MSWMLDLLLVWVIIEVVAEPERVGYWARRVRRGFLSGDRTDAECAREMHAEEYREWKGNRRAANKAGMDLTDYMAEVEERG